MYRSITHNIEVAVEPFYLAEKSDPEEARYVWGYRVTIANHSDDPIQVLARHWRITDGQGRIEEVRGPGVVGEQPLIEPGDSYAYASGCPLTTPSGSMVGAYFMQDAEGRMFEAAIPAFSLDVPDSRRVLN